MVHRADGPTSSLAAAKQRNRHRLRQRAAGKLPSRASPSEARVRRNGSSRRRGPALGARTSRLIFDPRRHPAAASKPEKRTAHLRRRADDDSSVCRWPGACRKAHAPPARHLRLYRHRRRPSARPTSPFFALPGASTTIRGVCLSELTLRPGRARTHGIPGRRRTAPCSRDIIARIAEDERMVTPDDHSWAMAGMLAGVLKRTPGLRKRRQRPQGACRLPACFGQRLARPAYSPERQNLAEFRSSASAFPEARLAFYRGRCDRATLSGAAAGAADFTSFSRRYLSAAASCPSFGVADHRRVDRHRRARRRAGPPPPAPPSRSRPLRRAGVLGARRGQNRPSWTMNPFAKLGPPSTAREDDVRGGNAVGSWIERPEGVLVAPAVRQAAARPAAARAGINRLAPRPCRSSACPSTVARFRILQAPPATISRGRRPRRRRLIRTTTGRAAQPVRRAPAPNRFSAPGTPSRPLIREPTVPAVRGSRRDTVDRGIEAGRRDRCARSRTKAAENRRRACSLSRFMAATSSLCVFSPNVAIRDGSRSCPARRCDLTEDDLDDRPGSASPRTAGGRRCAGW